MRLRFWRHRIEPAEPICIPNLSDYVLDVSPIDPVSLGFTPFDVPSEGRLFVAGLASASFTTAADDPPRKMVIDDGHRWWQIRRRVSHIVDVVVTGSDDDPIGFSLHYRPVGPTRTVRAWTKRGISRKLRKVEEAG